MAEFPFKLERADGEPVEPSGLYFGGMKNSTWPHSSRLHSLRQPAHLPRQISKPAARKTSTTKGAVRIYRKRPRFAYVAAACVRRLPEQGSRAAAVRPVRC